MLIQANPFGPLPPLPLDVRSWVAGGDSLPHLDIGRFGHLVWIEIFLDAVLWVRNGN